MTALIRTIGAAGGFATVLHSGEKDAGSVLLLTTRNGGEGQLWERLPSLDGSRAFSRITLKDAENAEEIEKFWRRRAGNDPDLWVLEVDVPFPERFIETREP